jgi:exodeoxyribonuclease V alpha subunit
MSQHVLPEEQTLSGQIERVTYTNPENGYTVARMRIRGRREAVTVVGRFTEPAPGEVMEITGIWKIHPSYGRQFEVFSHRSIAPTTVDGIKKYLGSGLIKGIGPVMAERIVDRFGKAALDIIENHSHRLAEIEGIGKKRISMISSAWQEQKEIRNVMIFLQSHGVGPAYAVRIFRRYGQDAVDVVTRNPYQLATDISGIGFLTADRIASRLGFEKNHPQRIRAGILYVLNQLADEGHVYYPHDMLVKKSTEILETTPETAARAIMDAAEDQQVVVEDPGLEATSPRDRAVYLKRFFVCESGIARHLAGLLQAPRSVRDVDSNKAVKWVQARLDFALAGMQCEALKCVLQNKVMVLTGGPGTGKTTIIRAMIEIFARVSARIKLAAPTGRAAKKMSDATGLSAGTIHRMLSFNHQAGGFQKNQDNPLKCDLLIVDEASMIDTVLMYHLLKAVPPAASLVLVGDVHQLPSVGPGSVLADIISSGAVPVVRLTEIFRQARKSRIIVNAHQINNGFMPKTDNENNDKSSDFYFIEQADPEKAVDIIVELVSKRIPRRFGLDPVSGIQVLSPMHRGAAGTLNLNRVLQEALNPGRPGISAGGTVFSLYDKVMQIRNNYDKQVFNGDMGQISSMDRETGQIDIDFDGRQVSYEFAELDEVVPAYAVSVHKAQGSEFPAVVIPLLTQHYMMLQRNLVYTAVTRGKVLVVIVGTRKAMAISVKNNTPARRHTRLAWRLAVSCRKFDGITEK